MRPDLSELHIYFGIGFMAAGAAIAFGAGIGLLVLGALLVAAGIVLAQPEPKLKQAPGAGAFDALMTTAPPEPLDVDESA